MNQTTKADSVILLVTVLAASGWLFTKSAIGGIPPLAFLGLRFLGAALLLALFAGRQLASLNKRQWQLSVLVGLAQSVGMLVWILAISLSSQISEGAFITSTLVILVPFVGRLFFADSISRETLLAMPVALAGLSLLALDGNWQFEPAQLLFLASAVCFALHINLLSYVGRQLPSLSSTCIQLAVVGVVGLISSGMFETWPATVSGEFWWWLAASITIATSLRYFLQTWGFKHSNPSHAAIIMILEPVWTAIMSVIWLGETFDSRKLAGCGLILVGLLITRRRQIVSVIKSMKQKAANDEKKSAATSS